MSKYKFIGITVVAVIVLAMVVWGVLKLTGVTSKIDKELAKRKLNETLDAEIESGRVTITPSLANDYADKLYAAMKGLGTDEDAVYEVFSHLQSRSDVLYLIRTFSVRNGRTLVEWITSELNSTERTRLNVILSGNNVNYSF